MVIHALGLCSHVRDGTTGTFNSVTRDVIYVVTHAASISVTPIMRSSILLLALPGTLAFEFPFKLSNFFASTIAPITTTAQTEDIPSPISRIAIIGAGAGGSSAAFWLSKARTRLGVNFEIDVYESNDYIGGREYSLLNHNYSSTKKKL